jgi:hypothetical protein
MPIALGVRHAPVAAASFIIVAYAAWLLRVVHRPIADLRAFRRRLVRLPVNRHRPRVRRLVGDSGFWWSQVGGAVIVLGSVWFVGHPPAARLGLIAVAWFVLMIGMSYELTLVYPTSRCRSCRYELRAHFRALLSRSSITCPECGSSWTQRELLLSEATAEKGVGSL